MPTTSFRFTPSLFVSNDAARRFGQQVAEGPIQEDMRKDPALGSPGSDLWIDMSNNDSDDNMIVWMALRNNLPKDRLAAMLDYRHRRGAYSGQPAGHWARPDAACHTGAAREYYEIKPMSASGIVAGSDKVTKINNFVAEFRLPYVAGVKYLPQGVRRKEILGGDNNLLSAMRAALLAMFKLASIRVFLIWERAAPALILYMIEIVVETADQRTLQPSAMRDLARYVVQNIIQLVVPGTGLVRPPVGKIIVELPEEVLVFRSALEGSAGGMVFDAVPGETHLLAVDEGGFQAIIAGQRALPVFLRSTGAMFNTEEWRRVLHQAALDEARLRDRAILIVGAVALGGVALYVCWPVIAAGEVAVMTAGPATGDAFLAQSFTSQAAPQVLGSGARWVAGTRVAGAAGDLAGGVAASQAGLDLARAGTLAAQAAMRSPAASQMAVSRASAGFAVAAAYVFSSVDADAAESIARLGVALAANLTYSPAWLLRPLTLPGLAPPPGSAAPMNFGDVLDPTMFPALNNALPDPTLPAAPRPKLRLIGKVKFT